MTVFAPILSPIEQDVRAVVEWLAEDLRRAARALRRHRPTVEDSRWCRACSTQLHREPHPCQHRAWASEAFALRQIPEPPE